MESNASSAIKSALARTVYENPITGALIDLRNRDQLELKLHEETNKFNSFFHPYSNLKWSDSGPNPDDKTVIQLGLSKLINLFV